MPARDPGPANLAACVVCRDEPAFYEFLTAEIGALPGVERVETAPIKQASPIGPVNGPGAGRAYGAGRVRSE